MTRMFPIAVLLVATLFGAGGGLVVNRVVRAAAALPEGAQVGTPNASGAVGDPKAAPVRPTVVAKTSDRDYLKTILCRNLFDSKLVGECDFDVKTANPAEAITDLKVTLLGTLVAIPATYSSALIIEDGEERAIGYSLNDKIRHAEIIAIEAKLVRLRRGDGREEVLTMDGEEPPPPAPEPSDEGEAKEGDDEVRELGENHFEIDSATLDKYLSDLEGISRLGRALLHRGPDGEYDGYRLSAIRRNTIADKLGIRNGDIVHAVNGKPLDSMASAMEAFNTMRSEKNFSFEVTRRGKKETMTYDVK